MAASAAAAAAAGLGHEAAVIFVVLFYRKCRYCIYLLTTTLPSKRRSRVLQSRFQLTCKRV